MNTSFAKQAADRLRKAGILPKSSAASGEPDSTEAPARPPGPVVSLPLYIAGAIVLSAGHAAVASQLGQASFALFTIGLTIIGTMVSYFLRRLGTPPRLLKSGTLILGLVFVSALRGAGIFGMLVPPEEAGSQEMLLVSALAFTATFASFLLLTDEAVIFTCVWTIAIIGLTGTVNINGELPVCFVVFLAAASFLLVHQNALSFGGATRLAGLRTGSAYRGRRSGLDSKISNWPLLRSHVLMAAAAWFVSLILGFLIAIPVQMIGRNMSLGAILQRLKVPSSPILRNNGVPRLIFDDATKFNIGLGPVDDDPTERLSVWSDRPEYWRGRTYDIYNGHGWNSSYGDPSQMRSRSMPSSQSADGINTYDLNPLYTQDEPRKRTERIINTYHVTTGMYGPFYHASEPMVLRSQMSYIFVRPDHTISGARGLNANYEIESDVSVAKPGDLRHSSTNYPPLIANQYTNPGPFYSDSLHDLTTQALAGIPDNPYDKASAIRRFIAARCTYTLAARPVPKDSDAAEFFLNDSREGYCDLYATAMAVMCRYAGLPARVATGFAPGIKADGDTEPKPGGRNDKRERYILRGTDQHAWAEVYFTGYGWIVFDATADTGGVEPTKQTPEPADKPHSTVNPFWKRKGPILFGGLGAALLLFVVVNELQGRLIRSRGLTAQATAYLISEREADAIYRTYALTLSRIRRKGLAFSPVSTMGEHLAAVRSEFGEDSAALLEPLIRLTEKALYGPSSITPDDAAAARRVSGQFLGVLKSKPKVRPKPQSDSGTDSDSDG